MDSSLELFCWLLFALPSLVDRREASTAGAGEERVEGVGGVSRHENACATITGQLAYDGCHCLLKCGPTERCSFSGDLRAIDIKQKQATLVKQVYLVLFRLEQVHYFVGGKCTSGSTHVFFVLGHMAVVVQAYQIFMRDGWKYA